jgi:hypothetical protein
MQDKIFSLIERRKLEAARKEVSKKLISIVKHLGKPMIEQGANCRYLPDMWMLEEQQDDYIILEPDEYMNEWNKGYYFDGLKYGINLCIKTLIYEDRVREVKATFNGYLVFSEEGGDVVGYAPFSEWENAMNMFYEASSIKEEKESVIIKQNLKEENKKQAKSIMTMLRHFWGY